MAVHNIQQLVDAQVGLWEKERLAAKGKQEGPTVSIHRLPSSGATVIGKKVSELLGFGFFDKEIVEEIAKEENIRESLVANLDEHFRTAIERHILDGFSSFILPKETTLRVLLSAPLADRVDWHAKKTGIDAADVQKILEMEEKSRLEFLKQDFGIDQIRPQDFDICIDTATFGIDGTADLIATAARKRFDRG